MAKIFFLLLFALSLIGCGEGYTVNSDGVIYNGGANFPYRASVRIIEEADPKTFQAINKRYGIDDKAVFFMGRIIDGADPQSFVVMGDRYTKDAVNVYFDGRNVMDANTTTFRILEGYYATDDDSIFTNGQRLEGADPGSFEILGGGWARDANGYFKAQRKVLVCDLDSFEILKEQGRMSARAIDKECYFWGAQQVPISDRETLKMLPAYYAKDESLVYWQDTIVGQADSQSFEVMGKEKGISIGRDNATCFFNGRQQTVEICDGFFEKAEEFCGCE